MKNTKFLFYALVIIFGFGLIGFAAKFTTYFENWYWLPFWPNMGDSLFIAAAAIFFLYIGLGGKHP